MSGEAFTIWTVRLATLLYVAALAIWLTANSLRGWQLARLTWTAAFLCYVAHVYGAFEFVHGWNHTAAYVETARQTDELFGLAWGGGIFFNYAFTILWLADAIWWWSDPEGHRRRPRSITGAIHGFLAFMFFNGAVVFGSGPVRWFGIAAVPTLLWLWWRSRRVGSALV